MFITKTKSKDTVTYYLAKSFKDPITGRVSTKVIERLGNIEEIQEKIGKNIDINKWAKDYAKKKTIAAKLTDNPKVAIHFNKKNKINRNEHKIKNAGYTYINKTCTELGLKRICTKISKEENINFNLYNVVTSLIVDIIYSSSNSQNISDINQYLIRPYNIKKTELLESLKLLAKYSFEIQKTIYKYITKYIKVDKNKLFYSCTNYSNINYQILNRSNADFTQHIVSLTKVFFDSNGFPCIFFCDNNINRHYSSYKKITKYIKSNFKDAYFYVLPNSIYSQMDSDILENFKQICNINQQNISSFDKDLQEWAINPKGWKLNLLNKLYNINDVENLINNIKTDTELKTNLQSSIFYKTKKIKVNNSATNALENQVILIMYNHGLKLWLKKMRDIQLTNVEQNSTSIADVTQKMSKFDGFYAVSYNSNKNILNSILKVLGTKINQVDYMLQYMKNEYVSRDYLFQEEAITTHYLTAFMSLSVLKYITYKLRNKFTNDEVVQNLKNINFTRIGEEGWLPVFNPNKVTEALSNVFGIDFDYEFISTKDMRKIIKL